VRGSFLMTKAAAYPKRVMAIGSNASPLVGVRSTVISVSVCLSVCLRVHSRISKTLVHNYSIFPCMLPVAVARFSPGDNAKVTYFRFDG